MLQPRRSPHKDGLNPPIPPVVFGGLWEGMGERQ